MNQHQILHLVPMFDEGIKTVGATGKEQRYAIARSRDIRGQLKGERYLVTTVNPGGVDIADSFQVACQQRRDAAQVYGLSLGNSFDQPQGY